MPDLSQLPSSASDCNCYIRSAPPSQKGKNQSCAQTCFLCTVRPSYKSEVASSLRTISATLRHVARTTREENPPRLRAPLLACCLSSMHLSSLGRANHPTKNPISPRPLLAATSPGQPCLSHVRLGASPLGCEPLVTVVAFTPSKTIHHTRKKNADKRSYTIPFRSRRRALSLATCLPSRTMLAGDRIAFTKAGVCGSGCSGKRTSVPRPRNADFGSGPRPVEQPPQLHLSSRRRGEAAPGS